MDVHLTKDKKVKKNFFYFLQLFKLVVIHDTELDRLCAMKGKVSDYNYNSFPNY